MIPLLQLPESVCLSVCLPIRQTAMRTFAPQGDTSCVSMTARLGKLSLIQQRTQPYRVFITAVSWKQHISGPDVQAHVTS